jgi:biopolymer transport protein ExbD
VITAEQAPQRASQPQLNLLLAVRIDNGGVQVEHSEGLRQRIPGLTDQALAQLQTVMTQVKQQFPQNSDVLVIPSDEVAYNDVVRVLERLKLAGFRNLSLGNRARGAEPAATDGGAR